MSNSINYICNLYVYLFFFGIYFLLILSSSSYNYKDLKYLIYYEYIINNNNDLKNWS